MMSPPFCLSRLGYARIARVTSSEELGTMSKNNLRGATLVRGLYRGFISYLDNVLIKMELIKFG